MCSSHIKPLLIVASIVSPDRVISQSLIAALIYDTVVAKNFFEPPSVRVATSELFVFSYTAIFLRRGPSPARTLCVLGHSRSYPAH